MKSLKRNRYSQKRTRKTEVFLKKKTENSLLRKIYTGFKVILGEKQEKYEKVL